MAFCSKCGSTVSEGSAFCVVCGSPVSLTGGTPTPPSPAGAAGASMTSNIAAALAYFFITGIIFLVVDPYRRDKFVRFHSFQAIAFWVVVIVIEIILSIITSITFFALGFLFPLVGLAVFVFWLFLMYKAYNNESFMIPVIGEWALKQAGQ